MAVRAGVEPTTLRLRVIASTNAPPCPKYNIYIYIIMLYLFALYIYIYIYMGLYIYIYIYIYIHIYIVWDCIYLYNICMYTWLISFRMSFSLAYIMFSNFNISNPIIKGNK